MNTVVTSREEILRASRELMREQGWPALSIRSVAAACGISVGSIYNYFDSKAALVEATVESIWREIFHRAEDDAACEDTQGCIVWLYGRMESGAARYPGFFTLHSYGFMQQDKPDGRRRMRRAWQHIADGLCAVIRRDPRVRPDAFGEQLTVEGFADVLFSLMLSALLRQDYDPGAVLEIIRRTIYENPR